MAAGAASAPAPMPNGMHASGKPLQLAISLPQSPGTKISLHLTVKASSVMLFLTSGGLDASPTGASMGSFIFAMPDRYNPSQPLSTPLYTLPSSVDFTTRMARLLARKTLRPCYVGNSIDLVGTAGGGSVEEEMAVFRAIVDVVVSEVQRSSDHGDGP